MATSNLTLTTNIDVVEETVLLDSDHHQEVQSGVQSDSSEIDLSSSSNSPCFVAVHIGAGFHSQNKTGSYRLLCEQICSSVIRLLKQGCNARTAAATACALLENSPLTNAGLGSNLTLDEKIECDASIMDKDGFGSVGAVSNIKNPIMIALSLLEAQSHGTLSMGRIVPCMLVGNGARLWAREKGFEEVDDEFLKTDPMKKSFFYYKKKLDELNEELTSSMSSLQTNFEQPQYSEHQLGGNTNNNASSSESSSQLFNQTELKETDESRSLDTVGAIVLDMNGHLASAISSGGILLKLPGRVGHASFFGCGCWVDEPDNDLLIDDQEEDESNSIAICTTGCGEYIIKTLFAKECAEHILANTHKPDYDLNEFYKKKFFNSRLLKNCPDKLIGALICKLQKLRSGGEGLKERKILELLVTHTTPSMCFGYMSSGMRKPKSVMSRKEEDKPSESVLISNIYIDLSSNEFNSSSSTSQTQNPNQAADFTQNGDNKKRKIINQNT